MYSRTDSSLDNKVADNYFSPEWYSSVCRISSPRSWLWRVRTIAWRNLWRIITWRHDCNDETSTLTVVLEEFRVTLLMWFCWKHTIFSKCVTTYCWQLLAYLWLKTEKGNVYHLNSYLLTIMKVLNNWMHFIKCTRT